MKKRSFHNTILLSIGIAIFIALPLYGQMPTPLKNSNEPKSEAQKPTKDTKTTQSNAKSFSSFPVLPTSNQRNQTSPDNANKKDGNTSPDWWLVYLTAALAFVGFIQLITFILQTFWMNAQRKRERKMASIDFCKTFTDIKDYLYNGKQSPFGVIPHLMVSHEMAETAFHPSLRDKIVRSFDEAWNIYHNECKKYRKTFDLKPEQWERDREELLIKLDKLLAIAGQN